MTDPERVPTEPPSSPHRRGLRKSIERLHPVFAIIATIAAVGAVLSGLTGYWTTFKTISNEVFGGAAPPRQSNTVSAGRASIAVLPFENLSKDAAQDYIVDGLVANLTSDISVHMPSLLVIASTSAQTYKGRAIDPKQVGRELSVRYLVTGSVQRDVQQVRVNAQLVDSETSSVLWTDRFDGDTGNLIVLQDKITARIAVSLGFAMINVTAQEAVKKGSNADADDLVLQAQAALYKARRTFGTRTEAEALYRKAVSIDPNNADALIGLGLVLSENLSNLQANRALNSEQIIKMRSEAIELLDRGQLIKPVSADLEYARFNICMVDGRWNDARRVAERSLEIDPNFVSGYNALGLSYLGVGEPDKAITAFMDGLARTGGRGPGETIFRSGIGFGHLLASRWDEAIDNLLKARVGQAGSLTVHTSLSAAYAEKGEMEAAKSSLADALKIAPKLSLARLRATSTLTDPAYIRLREATLYDGLRKAGLPEVSP